MSLNYNVTKWNNEIFHYSFHFRSCKWNDKSKSKLCYVVMETWLNKTEHHELLIHTDSSIWTLFNKYKLLNHFFPLQFTDNSRTCRNGKLGPQYILQYLFGRDHSYPPSPLDSLIWVGQFFRLTLPRNDSAYFGGREIRLLLLLGSLVSFLIPRATLFLVSPKISCFLL